MITLSITSQICAGKSRNTTTEGISCRRSSFLARKQVFAGRCGYVHFLLSAFICFAIVTDTAVAEKVTSKATAEGDGINHVSSNMSFDIVLSNRNW